MKLTNAEKKKLVSLAHALHPIVTIGQNGLKESIHEELEQALDHHQLVKVKIIADDRTQKQEIIDLLSLRHEAAVAQKIGHIAVLYRKNPKKEDLLKS